MPPVEQRIGQLEVMVRWFQGQGWPQYIRTPKAIPKALLQAHCRDLSASSSLTPETIKPPGTQEPEALGYLQYRLESWSEEGNNVALAEELIEGIEARLGGKTPFRAPRP